jgi:hypothetical protein
VQVRNIRPFSQYVPGDTEEIPDGAAFDPYHWEAVTAPKVIEVIPDPGAPDVLSAAAVSPAPVVADPPRLPYPAKEM